MDRDGIINQYHGDYTYLLNETTFLLGIIKFSKKVKEEGSLFIVITNKRCINKGHYTKTDVETVDGIFQSNYNKFWVSIQEFFSLYPSQCQGKKTPDKDKFQNLLSNRKLQ